MQSNPITFLQHALKQNTLKLMKYLCCISLNFHVSSTDFRRGADTVIQWCMHNEVFRLNSICYITKDNSVFMDQARRAKFYPRKGNSQNIMKYIWPAKFRVISHSTYHLLLLPVWLSRFCPGEVICWDSGVLDHPSPKCEPVLSPNSCCGFLMCLNDFFHFLLHRAETFNEGHCICPNHH